MSAVLGLVRDDLRGFAGCASARREAATGGVWLNANEAASPSLADPAGLARRYPEPQPAALRERLASLYGVDAGRLLLARGSDEAIDLLVRALCRPGRDAVVVTPPVFGMYAVAARCQAAPRVDVPLVADGDAFRVDFDAVARAALDGMPGVSGFHHDPVDGRLYVFPQGRAVSLDAVAERLRLRGVEHRGLQPERGRLDEVFRRITAPEASE